MTVNFFQIILTGNMYTAVEDLAEHGMAAEDMAVDDTAQMSESKAKRNTLFSFRMFKETLDK